MKHITIKELFLNFNIEENTILTFILDVDSLPFEVEIPELSEDRQIVYSDKYVQNWTVIDSKIIITVDKYDFFDIMQEAEEAYPDNFEDIITMGYNKEDGIFEWYNDEKSYR